jgi:hypothetical protein
VTIPAAKYVLFSKLQAAKRNNAEVLKDQITAMGAEAPDLVLYYNGTFVAFPQVVVKTSKILLRCLNDITMSDLFPYAIKRRTKKPDK